jgi:hypothetical protein
LRSPNEGGQNEVSPVVHSFSLGGTLRLLRSRRGHNLIGDVIFGTYDVPSADSDAFEQYEFSVNPFTVEANSAETNLNIIDGDFNTGVDFGASSVVFTFQQDTTWNPFPFNGTEFLVLSGNPFGNVVGVSSPEPVDARVDGGVLFVNWQGTSFKAGDTITIAFGVPEVPTWVMMFLGFGFLGVATSIGNKRAHARCS